MAAPAPKVPEGGSPGSYFSLTNSRVISWLGAQASFQQRTPGDPFVSARRQMLEKYFAYLEECRDLYGNSLPRDLYNGKESLLNGLVRIFDVEFVAKQRLFTDQDKNRAQVLHYWASTAEAAPETPTPVELSSANNRATSSRGSTSTTGGGGPSAGVIRKPPSGHPIWGVNGIMHGIATTGKNNTMCLNPDYKDKKRRADVFGHNDLDVGKWFPCQLSALFNGGHGSAQGGIYGSKDNGAYSVIVSGTYRGLDKDEGDVIWYSGSNAAANYDPENLLPVNDATNALITSSKKGTLVRVFRKAIDSKTTTSVWAPTVGIRYDGLYHVEKYFEDINENGGKYLKFKLVRALVDGKEQTSLEELKKVPSRAQWNKYERIKRYF